VTISNCFQAVLTAKAFVAEGSSGVCANLNNAGSRRVGSKVPAGIAVPNIQNVLLTGSIGAQMLVEGKAKDSTIIYPGSIPSPFRTNQRRKLELGMKRLRIHRCRPSFTWL
jgi:hypothetical protein